MVAKVSFVVALPPLRAHAKVRSPTRKRARAVDDTTTGEPPAKRAIKRVSAPTPAPKYRDDATPKEQDHVADGPVASSTEAWRIGDEVITHIETDGKNIDLVSSTGERRALGKTLAEAFEYAALRIRTITVTRPPRVSDFIKLAPFANATRLRVLRAPLQHNWWSLDWKLCLPHMHTLVLFPCVKGKGHRARIAIPPIPCGIRRVVLNLCLWREDGPQFDAVPFEEVTLANLLSVVRAKGPGNVLREVVVTFSFVPLGLRRATRPGLLDTLFDAVRITRHLKWQIVGIDRVAAEVGIDTSVEQSDTDSDNAKRDDSTKGEGEDPHPLDFLLSSPVPSLAKCRDPCLKLLVKDSDRHLRISTREEFAAEARSNQVAIETQTPYSERYVAERVAALYL